MTDNTTQAQATRAIESRKHQEIEYQPFNSTDKIKLSLSIIKNYIAEPAEGGLLPDDRQCLRFMMLCRARKLDPFEGDAFMIPFYDKRKQCHVWSLITAHNAFGKRAEVHPDYDGKESGIIIYPRVRCRPCDGNGANVAGVICPACRGIGSTDELQGDFLPEEIDGEQVKLVGGWCRVFFKKKTKPEYQRLKLTAYSKSFGVWQSDPAGMICKCAEAAALRSAFPNTMGGMYLREEGGLAEEVSSPMPELESQQPKRPVIETQVQVQPAESAKQIENPYEELCALAKAADVTHAQIVAFMKQAKIGLMDANSEDLPQCKDENLRTLIRTWDAVLPKIKAMKV